MLHAHGTFNGTGAALYIGIGFLPDWVVVQNLEDADVARLYWNIHMRRVAETTEGILHYTAAGLLGDPRSVSDTGIRPFRGGNKLTATSTSYLRRYDDDYRTSTTYGTIDTWTLGSSANRTGNFNLEADTTYVGEGSLVTIEEDMGHAVITAGLVALTSNGEQANEVTLSESVKTGSITALKGMYDYRGGITGDIIPDGFSIQATSVINVSGELSMFEAGTYDS